MNTISNKCIAYKVDVLLLNSGVPLEQLEKTNVREVAPFVEINYGWRKQTADTPPKPPKPLKPKKPPKPPKPPKAKKQDDTPIAIALTAIQNPLILKYQEYIKVARGTKVILPNNPELVGTVWKVANGRTGMYCIRVAVLEGNNIALI